MFYTTPRGCMWANVMCNLRVVSAVQGHSGVYYGVGYLAQTICSIVSSGVPGGIDCQSLSSPAFTSISPPAIDLGWLEMKRNLERSCLQSYSSRDRREISPPVPCFLKSCKSHTRRIFPSLRKQEHQTLVISFNQFGKARPLPHGQWPLRNPPE
jgi:hypothetical protein